MKSLLHAALLLSWTASFAFSDDPQHVPVGFIESISGNVKLRTPNSGEEPLDANKDCGRVVFYDQEFICQSGGVVKGEFLSGGQSVPVTNFCNHPPPRPRLDQQEPQNLEFRTGLERLGRRAGRNKGSESPIFEPAPNSAILPATLVVRWRTRPPLDAFTAVLQDASGKNVAEVPAVDGSAGELNSSMLRESLVKLRAADQPVKAVLLFHVSTDDEYKVNFTILSEGQEQELKLKMTRASAAGGLLAHVLRADVLSSYDLYGDAAAEYGLALEQAPNSVQLLRAALDAYARIGDLAHASDISDRLAKDEVQ